MIEEMYLTKDEFSIFAKLIEKNSGIVIDAGRTDALGTSLLLRVNELGFDDYLSYYYYLVNNEHGNDEFKELLNLITINETSFFRYEAQFEALRKKVLPELIDSKKGTNRLLRIWSAGCSTGEEPYSIAILLKEMGILEKDWQVEIMATDASQSVLDLAKKGEYNIRTMRYLYPDMVEKYFIKAGNDKYLLIDDIKSMVKFAYHNLKQMPYPQYLLNGFDLIMCRNVLIYFSKDIVRDIVRNFYECLMNGGYLLIGHSESLYTISEDFEIKRHNEAFFYFKPNQSKIEVRPEGLGHEPGLASQAAYRENIGNVVSDYKKLKAMLETALAAEDYAQALSAADSLLECNPEDIETRVQKSSLLINKSMYREAINEAAKALEIEPFLPSAYFISGMAYLRLGDTDNAVANLKKTIFIDKDYAIARFYLASVYSETDLPQKAVEEYKRTMTAINNNPEGSWRVFAGGYDQKVLKQVCVANLNALGIKT